ncbi:hypothetical protein ACIOHC_36095 [Streptomyces sp. NPDC088252]|uniref:hypothetical protein n=1 Tax=Streptomyces sp. NPDC088252 TaxID=3365845 RepID=UPI00380B3C38
MEQVPTEVRDRVFGRYKVSDELELHLRVREADDLPRTLDLSGYNTREGAYRMACFFPDDPRLVRSLIRGLSRYLEQEHGEDGNADV